MSKASTRKAGIRKTALRTAAIPAAGEGKRGEQGYLGYLLRQAAAAQRLRLERALADLGVTPPQFLVLTMLTAYPGASNADVARLTTLTPQTVNVIVGNLVRAGALKRTPHAAHGRVLQLGLTAKGRRQLAAARTRAHALEDEIGGGLSASEQTEPSGVGWCGSRPRGPSARPPAAAPPRRRPPPPHPSAARTAD